MYHNLIPEDVKKIYRNEYFSRLGTLSLIILSALFLFGSALLIPPHLLLSGKNQSLTAQKALLDELIEKQNGEALFAELSSSKEKISLLTGSKEADLHPVIGEIIETKPKGISLTRLSIKMGDGREFSLSLSGEAATRDTLLGFKGILSEMSQIKEIDLPVSLLARSEDIKFTITLSGTLMP